MDPQTVPAEQSAEVSGGSAPNNMPGVYSHPHVEQKLFALNGPQADAFVRLGFAWERNLRDSDIFVPAVGGPIQTAVLDDSAESKKKAEAASKEAIDAAKAQAASIIAGAEDEAARLRSGGANRGASANAITGSAEDLEEARTAREAAAKPSKGASDSEDLGSKSRADLDQLARDRGLDPDDYATKKELVAALESNQ